MITELPKSTRAVYTVFLKFSGDINDCSRLNKLLRDNHSELGAVGVHYAIDNNMIDEGQFVVNIYTRNTMTFNKFNKIYSRFVQLIESAGFDIHCEQVFATGARKTATEAIPIVSVNKFTIFSSSALEPLERPIQTLKMQNQDYHFEQVAVNPNGSQTWLAIRQYTSGNIQAVEVDALKTLAHGFKRVGMYTSMEQKTYNVYNLIGVNPCW